MSAAEGIPSFSAAGEPAGSVSVPAAFSGRANDHAVYLAAIAQLANRRTGTHHTKTRGEVSGGGRKPWKQKHTGRARQGSTRAPQWRHGAVIFGPRPRKYTREVPTQVRRLALRGAITEKIRSGRVAVLSGIAMEGKRTRDAAALLRKIGVKGSALLVLDAGNGDVKRIFANIPRLRVDTAASISAYDVISHGNVLVAAGALEKLAQRCGS